MDQSTLGLAAKLLAKAQATSFDAEAAALAERAYRLLAKELNAYDDRVSADGKPRQRERRHLHDRRSSAGAPRPSASASTAGATAAAGAGASAGAGAGTGPASASARTTGAPVAGRRVVHWFFTPGRSLVDLRV